MSPIETAWADEERAEPDHKQDKFVVVVPRLGPLLVVGKNAESATMDYVEGLIRRGVFPDTTPEEWRAWGKQVALGANQGPTLEALRAAGRPIIGIQLNSKDDLNGSDNWMSRRAAVAKAVIQAGGVPLYLPPAPDKKQIGSELNEIDHLILMGGADVSTDLQPGVSANPKVTTNIKIDRVEQEVIRQALDAGLGIHAICRGSQLVQVTFGGRLIQDIPSSGMTTLDHGSGQGPGKYAVQSIHFERDSEIGHALGRHLWLRGEHHHHQAVDPAHVAPGFRIVATAHDGIPEAIERFDGRVIGVQVHPEAASKGSALRNAFFRGTLMTRATEHMAARGRSSVPTLPTTSPRGLTLALHSTIGTRTLQPTWNVWRAPPPPHVPATPPPRPPTPQAALSSSIHPRIAGH